MTDNIKNISNIVLPAGIQQPQYDRQALVPRIVHIGFGAFHRAHQALLTDRVLNQTGGDWGICEVVLYSDDTMITALRQQDHLFTVLEKSADKNQAIIVGAVCRSLHAKVDGIKAIIEQLAAPETAIVSLTITEKGYCIDRSNGELDLNNALIQQDHIDLHHPASVPGLLAEALRLRHERGMKPFTVLSCDNMPENGKMAKKAVLACAQIRSRELAAWIEASVPFPNSMVDRIVPAATPDVLQEIADKLGVIDPCAIACEPFIQWVIEDHFIAGRPAWGEVAGVQLVQDVLPFEEMKLRMLNGSHSFLAYLGYLAGYEHISDCMQDEDYRRAVSHLMLAEQAPTLRLLDIDLKDYAVQLLTRFSNPALKHRTWQIAMDGSQKLPQRLLEPLRWHLQTGSDYRYLALGIAGWMRYVSGQDDAKKVIDIRDPMAEKLKQVVTETLEGAERVSALLHLRAIFGEDLPANHDVFNALTQAYLKLLDHGAKKTLAALVLELKEQ